MNDSNKHGAIIAVNSNSYGLYGDNMGPDLAGTPNERPRHKLEVEFILDQVPGAFHEPMDLVNVILQNPYVTVVTYGTNGGSALPTPEGGSAPVMTEEQREALEFVIGATDASCGISELVQKYLAVLRDMMVVPYGAKPLAGDRCNYCGLPNPNNNPYCACHSSDEVSGDEIPTGSYDEDEIKIVNDWLAGKDIEHLDVDEPLSKKLQS